MKQAYNLLLSDTVVDRPGTPPWVDEPRRELVRLVNDGTLTSCRVIDLGWGVGDNAIFLAQTGFTVTGLPKGTSSLSRHYRNGWVQG